MDMCAYMGACVSLASSLQLLLSTSATRLPMISTKDMVKTRDNGPAIFHVAGVAHSWFVILSDPCLLLQCF